MDKYEILGQVGEGSFGQVYKAKKRTNGEIVAFKVIRKRGRTVKELKSLRQECEIQRHLHHPNIVQMLDSFETDNEIVVVIEYADRELYEILGKAGCLSEERAQVIACDLVSALYYLHSNRVLHRDLKPQNVLLQANGVAKVCDFGFARSMSTGTHVLTSIKGTPLYMAPELIEACPYDHNADLWSLGCIIYELIVGTPPFQTTSILHLVILLRFQEVKWPEFMSPNCKSFLQGLLQKDPTQRLTWPDLLEHPFVKDRILKVGEIAETPFTTALSTSQAWAKQQQLESLALCSANQFKYANTINRAVFAMEKVVEKIQEQERKLREQRYRMCVSQPRYPMTQGCYPLEKQYNALRHSEPSGTDSNASVDVLLGNLSLRASLRSDLFTVDNSTFPDDRRMFRTRETKPVNRQEIPSDETVSPFIRVPEKYTSLINAQGDGVNVIAQEISESLESHVPLGDGDCKQTRIIRGWEQDRTEDDRQAEKQSRLPDWDLSAVGRHMENEEWIAFLQRSMEELMNGDVASVLEQSFVSVLISPLRNLAAGCRVVEYVACLLSLPFVVKVSRENLEKIQRIYIDVRVVPNLVYAMKLLMSDRTDPDNASVSPHSMITKTASELSSDELQTLESGILLLCRLVHAKGKFLTQFCDAIYIVNGMPFLEQLLALDRRKPRIVSDLVAILNNILRTQPENAALVETVVLRTENNATKEGFSKLLTHRHVVLRARACTLIKLLGRFCCRALQRVWCKEFKNLLESLTRDNDDVVKTAADGAVSELKHLMYYNQENPAD